MDIVLDAPENFHGNVCTEVLSNIVACQHVFVNYSGLKFSQIFRTQRTFFEVFYKSSRASLINAVLKYLNFRSSSSKLESIIFKFTKSHTPPEVVFENFHCKCRTATLKNASRWLLLGTTLFSKYSSMAASQSQLQRYIYFRNSALHMFQISYPDVNEERILMNIFLSEGFGGSVSTQHQL